MGYRTKLTMPFHGPLVKVSHLTILLDLIQWLRKRYHNRYLDEHTERLTDRCGQQQYSMTFLLQQSVKITSNLLGIDSFSFMLFNKI